MINGITILHTEMIMEAQAWLVIMAGTLAIIGIIGTLSALAFPDSSSLGVTIAISCLACLTIGFIFCVVAECTEVETGRYKYKVLIDDTVNLIEFEQKYEIISKEGEIYTISEKEAKKND